MILDLIEDDALFAPNDGGQQQFMDDYVHQFIALAGGWYAGKTWAGARKLMNLHVHNAFNDVGEPTFVKSLCVGQNYGLARQVNIPEIQAACDEMGLAHRFVADPKRYCFEFPDLGTKAKPSELMVRSGDSPETINGFTVGSVWGDETPRWASSEDDPKRDALIQTRGRLRDPKARILQANFTFTHEGDGTRVYREFEEKPLPDHVLYRAGTFQNPHAAEFAATLEGQLTPELRDQYLVGNAVSFRGSKVYSAFDSRPSPEGNINDGLHLDPVLPLQLAIDFNINPGMHAIIGQHWRSRDTLTAVHELHGKSMSAVQMLEAFRSFIAKSGGWKWPTLEVFGDPAGSARFEATGESSWQIVYQWFASNMPGVVIRRCVKSAHPAVADRVNAVNCALRTMDGRIRYQIHPRCERLVADLKTLKWDGNEIDKKDRKLSHASDADGYRVEYLMPVRRPVSSTISYATT